MFTRVAPFFREAYCLAFIFITTSLGFGAEPRFLTLPFANPNIFVGQGWVYDSPGPFFCAEFGDRCHKGIDYFLGSRSAGIAFDVLAAATGKAIASFSESYGYFILIRHPEVDSLGQNYFTLYAHLKKDSWTVPFKVLDSMKQNISSGSFSGWRDVLRGERIGTAGDTGFANSIHLHFEVQRGGYPLNKTDPYDIYGTSDLYPEPCGSQFLWTQCPPIAPGVLTAPTLISPINNTTIAQNNPNIGCPSDPSRGFGFRIAFDWTESFSSNGIAGYQIVAKHQGALLPIVDTFVTASEFTFTSCNSFVIDANLEGFEWQVRAQDNLGNFSPFSDVGVFRFAPCRLGDGTACNAPSLSANGNVSIRRVGIANTISSAPGGTSAFVDSLASQSANPAAFTGISAGSHTAFATDKAGFTETAGTCNFPIGLAECAVSVFPLTPTCNGTSCSVPITVLENQVTKVVFKYVAVIPECSDGIDNDGNGLIDYPDDPGCDSPDDPIEGGGVKEI